MRIPRIERVRKWRSKIVSKPCPECGIIVVVKNSYLGICDPCRIIRRARAHPKSYILCQQCGILYHPSRLNRKYCSLDCKIKGYTGKPNSGRGKKYPHKNRARIANCLSCGIEFRGVKDTKRRKQLYCSHNCYLKNRRKSGFEQRVGELLLKSGISVDGQVKIGKWTFDFQIQGTNILIEADGFFWHGSKKVKERDERKDLWCKHNGYILFRVEEMKFYKDPQSSISHILLSRSEGAAA